MSFSLEEINQLQKVDFVEVFSNVVECYPEAAESVSNLAPFDTFSTLLEAFMTHLDQLDSLSKFSFWVFRAEDFYWDEFFFL